MRFKGVSFLLLVLLSAAITACGGRPHVPLSEEETALRQEVQEAISAADVSDFNQSFERLSAYGFDRYVRTEQYDDADFMVAFEEYSLNVEGSGEGRSMRTVRTDSAGSFDFGFFNRFVSENVDSPDPVNLIPYVLPDELEYDNPRHMDKYRFTFATDTLIWNRQARVVEIRAKPELADGLNIRLARQFIDIETNKLVGVYLERIDLSLLFREESTFYVDLQPGPEGKFLPYNTRFQTKIGTPFRGTFKIRTVSTFSSYRSESGR